MVVVNNFYTKVNFKAGDQFCVITDKIYYCNVIEDIDGVLNSNRSKFTITGEYGKYFNFILNRDPDPAKDRYAPGVIVFNYVDKTYWVQVIEDDNLAWQRINNPQISNILKPYIDNIVPNYLYIGTNTIYITGSNLYRDSKIEFTNVDYKIVSKEVLNSQTAKITVEVSNVTSDTGELIVTNLISTSKEIKLYKKKPVPIIYDTDPFDDKSQKMYLTFDGEIKDLCNPSRKISGSKYFESYDTVMFKNVLNYPSSVQIDISDRLDDKKVSLIFWTKVQAWSIAMLWGTKNFDGYIYSGKLGYNTAQGDLYGVDFSEYRNKWLQLIYEIDIENQILNLYINGVKQTLKQWYGRQQKSYIQFSDCLRIYGWCNNSSYTSWGKTANFRWFNRFLAQEEKDYLYQEELKYVNS